MLKLTRHTDSRQMAIHRISLYFMEVPARTGYARSTGIIPISRYRSLPLRWGMRIPSPGRRP